MNRLTSARRRAGLGALALVLAASALAGCASSSGGQTSSVAASAAASSVTCPTPALTTTLPGEQQTVQSGGQTRTYNIWLPLGYTGTTPVPVVVDFHGTSEQALSYETSFSPIAQDGPARGYIVVAPQAVKGDATALRWRVPGTGEKPDDVQFVSDLLQSLQQKYCINPKRLYATGFSSGGAFTTYVSCQLDVWAAVAPMSGVSLVQPCPTKPPVAMITFHGTNDLFVPFNGLPGADSTANPDGYYEGDVQKSVDAWALRNGCQALRIDTVVPPVGVTTGPGSKITKRTYSGCKTGDDVVFYIIDGTGHAYPGGPPIPAAEAANLGGQSESIDAGSLILDFFDQHQRVTAPNFTPSPEILASPSTPASVAATPATSVTP